MGKVVGRNKIGKVVAAGAGVVGILVALSLIPASPAAVGGLVVALVVAIILS